MKSYKVRYAEAALVSLQKLEKNTAKRIYLKIDFYLATEDPLAHAKLLSGKLKGFYRYRVGGYRIIFSAEEDGPLSILTVLYVGHRRDIYK